LQGDKLTAIFRHADRLRHLALIAPVMEVEYEATPENLRRRSMLSEKDSYGIASMMFFNKVQFMARRAANLPLRTLTLTFCDPIVRNLPPFTIETPHKETLFHPCGFDVHWSLCIPVIYSDVGVARAFRGDGLPGGASSDFWTARIEFCRWKLRQLHGARWLGLYSLSEVLDARTNYWGDEGLEVRMATVDRVYVGTSIVRS
jgi:hypothetical protein